MLRELIYLKEGIEKKVCNKLQEIMDEGKKEYEDKDLFEIGKEHLRKRKNQIEKLFVSDFKNMADELGLATKKDLEELKEYIKNRN